jgi:hypothetical protein
MPTKPSISYFRRMAAQSYRAARSSVKPHLDYESLMRLGDAFKARATAAAERLGRMRQASRGEQAANRRNR